MSKPRQGRTKFWKSGSDLNLKVGALVAHCITWTLGLALRARKDPAWLDYYSKCWSSELGQQEIEWMPLLTVRPEEIHQRFAYSFHN